MERNAEGETMLARCEECGEEKRVGDVFLDVVALDWQMHQAGSDELPGDTPEDIRWVWEHSCDLLALVDKATGEHIFAEGWASGARLARAHRRRPMRAKVVRRRLVSLKSMTMNRSGRG